MKQELKKCLCGATPEIIPTFAEDQDSPVCGVACRAYKIKCPKCGTTTIPVRTKNELIQPWNTEIETLREKWNRRDKE